MKSETVVSAKPTVQKVSETEKPKIFKLLGRFFDGVILLALATSLLYAYTCIWSLQQNVNNLSLEIMEARMAIRSLKMEVSTAYSQENNEKSFGNEIQDIQSGQATETFEQRGKRNIEGVGASQNSVKNFTETDSGEMLMSREEDFKSDRPVTTTPIFRQHRKHRHRGVPASAQRFITETEATTSTPMKVRQSRTQLTHNFGVVKKSVPVHYQEQTSGLTEIISEEEFFEERNTSGQKSAESNRKTRHCPAQCFSILAVHYSADLAKSRQFSGNGKTATTSSVYKDWIPANWANKSGMVDYFRLDEGEVKVLKTGIYLVYAQIYYSTAHDVNGYKVLHNNQPVAQCAATSSNSHNKSHSCSISLTVLLKTSDVVAIKDLHTGRHVMLTPERSYFGLILLTPFGR